MHRDVLVEILRQQHFRLEALEAALRRYAHHTNSCRYHGGHDCDCGLDKIYAAPAPETGK
jgi:hypothetical protein